MEIIYILLPASIFLAVLGLGAFFWSVKNDQFSDLESPQRKMLLDPEEKSNLKKDTLS